MPSEQLTPIPVVLLKGVVRCNKVRIFTTKLGIDRLDELWFNKQKSTKNRV